MTEQQTEQQAMPFDVPATPAIAVVTFGGSHRAIQRAVNALTRAGIRHKWLGPVNLGSNRHRYAIPAADLDKAIALNVGITRAREQPAWLAGTDPDRYFV